MCFPPGYSYPLCAPLCICEPSSLLVFYSMFSPARYVCALPVLSLLLSEPLYFLFYFDSLPSVLRLLLPRLVMIISVTCVPRVLPLPSLTLCVFRSASPSVLCRVLPHSWPCVSLCISVLFPSVVPYQFASPFFCPAIKLCFEFIPASVSLRLGPLPACHTAGSWQVYIFLILYAHISQNPTSLKIRFKFQSSCYVLKYTYK